MATSRPKIETLPYEILTSILTYWPTFLLSSFRLISPSFRDAVDSLLYTRFKEHYNTLDGHNFIFESPADKRAHWDLPSVPYYECVYKGSKRVRPGSSFSGGEWGEPERDEMAALGEWWSSFVPTESVIVKCAVETTVFKPLGSLVSRGPKLGILTTANSVFEGVELTLSKEWLESQVERGESCEGFEGEWVQLARKRGGVALRIKVHKDESVVGEEPAYKVAFEEVMISMGRLMIILERAKAEEIEILGPLVAEQVRRERGAPRPKQHYTRSMGTV